MESFKRSGLTLINPAFLFDSQFGFQYFKQTPFEYLYMDLCLCMGLSVSCCPKTVKYIVLIK